MSDMLDTRYDLEFPADAPRQKRVITTQEQTAKIIGVSERRRTAPQADSKDVVEWVWYDVSLEFIGGPVNEMLGRDPMTLRYDLGVGITAEGAPSVQASVRGGPINFGLAGLYKAVGVSTKVAALSELVGSEVYAFVGPEMRKDPANPGSKVATGFASVTKLARQPQ